jgi:hypothetical protein
VSKTAIIEAAKNLDLRSIVEDHEHVSSRLKASRKRDKTFLAAIG